MADSDKNILITPSVGVATETPSIVFTGYENDPMTLNVTDGIGGGNKGIEIVGSDGQAFNVTPELGSGSIFRANDISGIPLIEAKSSGVVALNQFGISSNTAVGSVGIGTDAPDGLVELKSGHTVGDLSGVHLRFNYTGDGPNDTIGSITFGNAANDNLAIIQSHTVGSNTVGSLRFMINGSGRAVINSSGLTVTGIVAATSGNSTDWNEAHGWGNHTGGGYLTSLGTAIVDADFGSTAGFCKVTGSGTYSVDTSTYLTSLGTAIVDADFGSTAGFCKVTGSGTYSVDTSTYLTSLGTAIVDADFGSTAGFCKVTGSGSYSVDTSTYLTSLGTAIVDADFGSTAGFCKVTGSGSYSVDTSTYLTSLGTAIVDADFGSTAGFCKVTGSGAYSVDTSAYTTYTANQSVDTTSDVTFNTVGALSGVKSGTVHFSWSDTTGVFTNAVADMVSYLSFGNNQLWGWVEVTLTGGFVNTPISGKYTKRYKIGRNATSAIHNQSSEVPSSFGEISANFKLGDFEISGNDLRIPIYNVGVAGNAVEVYVEGHVYEGTGGGADNIDDILGSLSLSAPAVVSNSETRDYYSIMSDRLGVGTTSPANKLHIANGNIRLQAESQTSGDFSQTLALKFSQETDSEFAKIMVSRPSWAGAPSDMSFWTRDVSSGSINNVMELTNDGTLDQKYNYLVNSQTVNDLQTRSSHQFDGSDYVTIPTTSSDIRSLSEGTNSFSAEAWVKLDADLDGTSTNYHIMGDEDYEDYGWLVRVESSNSNLLNFRMSSGVSGNLTHYVSSATNSYPDDKKWHHIVVVRSYTNLTYTWSGKIYLDGVELDVTNSGNWAEGTTSGVDFSIGEHNPTATSQRWEGEISKVRLYNRDLSADEVKAYYNGHAVPYGETGAKINYVSDFSAGVDGWVSTYGVGAGNIDSIAGENDNFRYTSNTGSSNKIVHYVSDYEYTLTDAHKPRLSFDIYIPSANSHINGVQVSMGQVLSGVATLVSNTWITMSTDLTHLANLPTSDTLEIYFANSGSLTFDDGGGDIVYLRNVKISTGGCMAEYLPTSIGASQWLDTSGNDLHGAVTGATQVGQNIFGGNVGIGTASPAQPLHVHYSGTGTLAKFQSTGREANILLQNDAQTWKIVNYDYTNAGGDHLGFHDGTADRLVIGNNGKVGIGTSSPQKDLHIQSAGGTSARARFTSGGAAGHYGVLGIEFDTTQGQDAPKTSIIANGIGSFGKSDLYFSLRSSNDWSVVAVSADAKMVIKNSGNVGIGTASPDAVLHVDGVGSVTNKHYVLSASSIFEAGESRVQILASDGGNQAATLLLSNETKHWVIQQRGPDDNNKFTIGNYTSTATGHDAPGLDTKRFTITTDGDVGIGTTSPTDKFEVHGTSGELLSVADDLSGVLFSANDVSGLPVIEAHASGNVVLSEYGGHVGIGLDTPAYLTQRLSLTGTSSSSENETPLFIHHNIASGTEGWALGVSRMGALASTGMVSSISLGSDTSNRGLICANNNDLRLGTNYGGVFYPIMSIGGMNPHNTPQNIGIGTLSPHVALHLGTVTDVDLTTGGGTLQIGLTNTWNMVVDDNEIQARNNGSSSPLHLNSDGSDVTIGQNNIVLHAGNYSTYANNYVHPTESGSDFSVVLSNLTGAGVISGLNIAVTTNTLGHVTGTSSIATTRNLTLADLGYTGATNANNYSHPTHAGDDISLDTTALSGAVVISDLDFNVTTDTLGHVTDANGAIATRTLTLANLGYTGAANANYITNNNQLTNGASYITGLTIAQVTSGNVPITNIHTYWSANDMATATGAQAALQIYNQGVGNDAFMSFHASGDYAIYFGLDADSNKLSVGGWSYGASKDAIYHEGNKPSLADLGYTGATNANYITNNNQLTNGASYITDGNTGWNNSYGFVTSSGVTSVATGGGLTGGTITSTGTISHADTSSVSTVNNSGQDFIQDLSFDTYGHVTAWTTATASGGGGGGASQATAIIMSMVFG